MRQIILWTFLALVGLAVTAAVTVAASSLSGQSFALEAEPLDASQSLAPPPRTTPPPRAQASQPKHRTKAKAKAKVKSHRPPTTSSPATPVAPPTAAPVVPPRTVPAPPPARTNDDSTRPRRPQSGEQSRDDD